MKAPDPDGKPRRRALLVANGTYREPQLHDLGSPRNDAAALTRILGDPELGAFEVTALLDEPESVVRREIYDLFHRAGPDDFCLLYFSCHGMKDEYGELFFAAQDTEVERLPPTAVPADYVRDQMERSACTRVAVIADCCYAGAFVRGLRSKSAPVDFELDTALGGKGRVVIAATSSVSNAYESDDHTDPAMLSYFTTALVEGVSSGAADRDSDGVISVMDAYHYADEWLRGHGIPQRPRASSWNVEGRLVLSRAPVSAASLLPAFAAHVRSPNAQVRLRVIIQLRRLLSSSPEAARAAAARSQLRQLQRDSDPEVSRAALQALSGDPPAPGSAGRWYQSAVFYQVVVRSYLDSNADGTGDLVGLREKLDYLQWLGVDCVILIGLDEHDPPGPNPAHGAGAEPVPDDVGCLEDFRALVEDAHGRGIRVVVDVSMNDTGDQHPWFTESRSDPDGPYGDFYVWSDTDLRYPDARIIRTDTETSNWTFDQARRQYYWHRSSAHRPDLNFDNPAVVDAVLGTLRSWLDLDVDGLRLGAVPFLFEEEGTSCENLPRTHDLLTRIRAMVDAEYPDRMLLCEANQWPFDLLGYFGTGDECHMALHYPVMPRLFMAVRRESRHCVSDILAQAPEIPAGCQWGIFLRDHDELTMEMVTDDERDHLQAEYAQDPRARSDVGIRRRLAPLVSNDRKQIELLTALLLSLPGSPILYYGDEIGMGDNIWLPGSDGVRTPMQWTPDRNAGFSRAEPGRLIRPVVADPMYTYQAVNVEAQLGDPASLLHWTRRMIDIRRRQPAFGVGAFTEIASLNSSVLSYTRELGDVVVLCVNNLSRFGQPVSLDLSWYEGWTPVEMLGGVKFPRIGDWPYPLTLGPHSFIWLELKPG